MTSNITQTLSEKLPSLRKQLSAGASVNEASEPDFQSLAARWSDYSCPNPGALINVATEEDIATTVRWAVSSNVKFLVQGGGHGYQATWTIGPDDIIINTRPLAGTVIDISSHTAVINAGTLVGEANNAAHASHVHLALGTCNSVGVLGAVLGGGIGNFQGLYGLSIDSLISLRFVSATGDLFTVTPKSHPDLWNALRGAGHNFGIMTSITMRVYPELNSGLHWTSLLIFPPHKIREVAQIVNDTPLGQKSSVHIFMMQPPPDFQPAFATSLWYAGTPEEGKAHFSSLFAAGPVAEMGPPGGVTPANMLNSAADEMAKKGGRKPCVATSLEELNPEAVERCWELLVDFLARHPSAGESGLVFEVYDTAKVMQVPEEESAFALRRYGVHAVGFLKYKDAALDNAAAAFGEEFRKVVREGSGMEKAKVYCNFAIGDETAEEMYGDAARIEKLKAIKAKWDPENLFSEYHPFN